MLCSTCSRFMFGPYRIPYIDSLYFWDSNVDHRVGRAMMSRNFSNISVGVIKQVSLYCTCTTAMCSAVVIFGGIVCCCWSLDYFGTLGVSSTCADALLSITQPCTIGALHAPSLLKPKRSEAAVSTVVCTCRLLLDCACR